MVLANDEASGNEVIADAHVLPATHITYADGVTLLAYLKTTRFVTDINVIRILTNWPISSVG